MNKLYYNKRTTILSELILINNNLNYINKNYDKPKKIYKKLFKKTRNISRYIQNNEIDNSKIYRYHGYKYKLSNDTDIVLKNRYLDKYNYYISKSLLSKDLLDAGIL